MRYPTSSVAVASGMLFQDRILAHHWVDRDQLALGFRAYV